MLWKRRYQYYQHSGKSIESVEIDVVVESLSNQSHQGSQDCRSVFGQVSAVRDRLDAESRDSLKKGWNSQI